MKISVVIAPRMFVVDALEQVFQHLNVLRLRFSALTAEVLLVAVPMTKRANPRELIAAVVWDQAAHWLVVLVVHANLNRRVI